jgi:hypothetical protein
MRRLVLLLALLLLLLPLVVAGQSLPLWPLLDPHTPLNRQHPLSRGLMSGWQVIPGLSGGATWYNLAAPYHGTLVNMTTAGGASGWGSTVRTGGHGELRVDGVGGYVRVGAFSAYDFPNQSFTVSLCHRASTPGYLVARRSGTCDAGCGGWFLRLDSGGTYTARVVDDGNVSAGNRTSVTTTALNGAWHHIAVVFTTNTVTLASNDVTLYHNGVEDQGSRTDSGVAPYTASVFPLVFGMTSDADVTTAMTGALDAIWIWNRGLQASDMPALAATCRQRSPFLAYASLPLLLAPSSGRHRRPPVYYNDHEWFSHLWRYVYAE